MGRVLQLSNAANWEQIYNTSVAAVNITPDTHVPIAEITVPFLIDTHVLAVYITTDVPEGREWFFAGYLNQKFELGLTVGGTPEADELSRRKLSINRIKLIILPKITANYAISFSVPKWFKSVQITVWQYIGTDYDSIEQTINQDIQPALARIESKVDAIS
jgi:hypothetical protein